MGRCFGKEPRENRVPSGRIVFKKLCTVPQEEKINSYQTTNDGVPVWFDMIYEHASDTSTDPI